MHPKFKRLTPETTNTSTTGGTAAMPAGRSETATKRGEDTSILRSYRASSQSAASNGEEKELLGEAHRC